ncbi:hypothetical protein [Tenacibaculum ovolyticum]|uniref:hypothetical protein n=1 Tax=Tenacibaculum ovolyticum TaxID=104270 RepID=UPI000B14CC46|nr:hypothetical protein [Tenacibaculum ovolyticum]
MHNIKQKKTKKTKYEGLRPKLIHLSPKTFELLEACAKMKSISFKKYIEECCDKQALYEANKFLKESNKKE